MTNTKFYLLVGTLGLVITTLSVSAITFAHEGFGPGGAKFEHKLENLSEEKKIEMEARRAEFEAKHAELEEIIENEDYEAWVDLMEERGMDADFITEENFAKFVQMHQLMEEGRQKLEEAHAIAEELGLDKFGKSGYGHKIFRHKSVRDKN